MNLEHIENYIEQHFEEQVQWLEQVVNVPRQTSRIDKVEQAAQMTDAMAQSLGLKIQKIPDPQKHFADHRVYSSAHITNQDKAMALVGHLDIVQQEGQDYRPFRRDEHDPDRVHGSGVIDMTGGVSVLFFALKAIKQTHPELWERLCLRVILVTDEEVSSPSSTQVVYSIYAPVTSKALVAEPSREGDRIVISRSGIVTYQLQAAPTFSGQLALAFLGLRLSTLTNYEDQTTINAGLLSQDAGLCVECRTVRFDEAQICKRSMQSLIQKKDYGSFSSEENPSSKKLDEALLSLVHSLRLSEMVSTTHIIRKTSSIECQIEVQGRGAHSGLHHDQGVNAICGLYISLIRIALMIRDCTDVTLKIIDLKGGVAKNTVAPEASCVVVMESQNQSLLDSILSSIEEVRDWQITVEESPSSVKESLDLCWQALVSRFALQEQKIDSIIVGDRPPMEAKPENRELAQAYGVVAKRYQLSDEIAPHQGGGSDLNVFATYQVPGIDGLGPAGADLHQSTEWCSLLSLKKRTLALAAYLVSEFSS